MIKCPLCQILIDDSGSIESIACPNCWMPTTAPYFKCYFEQNIFSGYACNIMIDNQLYGIDSFYYLDNPLTKIIIRSNTDATWNNLYHFDEFTPLPHNKQEIEKIIRRIINLKAFL